MAMRWLPAACIVLAAGSARGDDTDGVMAPSRVSATLGASSTSATLRARFELAVSGPATELTNELHTELPEHAVVTAATVREHGHVEHLELARIASVDEKFTALASRRSNGTDRRWAVRIDATTTEAIIGVAAPRAATLTLDIVYEAPTCFFDDVRYVAIPQPWVGTFPARFVPKRPNAEISEECANGTTGDWLAIPSAQLAKRSGGEARIGVTANRLSLTSRDVAQLEVSLAGQLTEIPADLHTAIVVDHSRSLTAAQRENERAIVEAYLRAAPRGRVQVIGYARTAAPLLSGWMPASQAATRVDRALRNLPPRNGSNIDEGLAVAGAWLSNIKGTRRVIVFTDERISHRLSGETVLLRRGLPDHTLVHVVNVFGGTGSLFRNDDGLLSRFAVATGGIGVAGGPDDNGQVDAMLLARPTSLDNVEIQGAGWEASLDDRRSCPLGLDGFSEGSSCMWWGTGTPASSALTITGELWGRPFKRSVTPNGTHARSVARALSTFETLDGELLREVEVAALAVNSVWSLFAMWGGSGGYDETEMSGTIGGSSFSCCGHIGTSSRDRGTGSGTSVLSEELQQQLAGAVARCQPRSPVTVAVETTLDEILTVDVGVRDGDVAIRDCITEGVWDTSLTLVFPPSYARTKLTFQPS